ncbi:Hsp70 family protein [Nocardia sp. NPDC050710]|uniref:Hsp70 family protein n=1 Tax=Nocardia sp. NPDC050710 TaxID=3157220 RepID=UPI0034003D30
MTERLALGITVGASNSVAVATSGDVGDNETGPARGGTVLAHPSVLRLSPDAAPTFGASARPTGRHSSDIVLEGFLDRVGDPIDMLAEDGTAHSAADLMATAIGCLIDESTTATTQSPAAVVACHPAWWSRHTVEVQRAALAGAGLPEVTLVPEPTAAVRWLAAAHGPLDDGAVVVYDLGATGLTVSVVRTGAMAGPLGTPLRSTDVAGAEFDLLTMRYVLANALDGNEFDPFDPVVERELSVLRGRCRNAKEELSINTATVVPVHLDPTAPRQQIRLVRGELEELLRGPLLTSLDLIRDAVHRAGLEIGDIGRVLLTGGGGAIPLVAELISTEFGLPVVAAPEPAQTSARGAAALAAEVLATRVHPTPQPLATLASAKTEELPAVSRTAAAAVPRSGTPPKALPTPNSRPGRALTGRRRIAIIAGAAVVIGLLATGTVAIGTGAQSGTNPPASTQHSTTASQEAAGTTTPDGTAPALPAADPAGVSSEQSKPRAGQQVSAPTNTPGSTTVAVVNSEPAPGQPAPAASTSAEPGAAQPQPGSQPQPQPTPQPAPQPAPQVPAPNPRPAPQQPQIPNLPTGVLSDTIDGVGDGVGTVLRVPGEILGGNGG